MTIPVQSNIPDSTKIADLTVGELKNLIHEVLRDLLEDTLPNSELDQPFHPI